MDNSGGLGLTPETPGIADVVQRLRAALLA